MVRHPRQLTRLAGNYVLGTFPERRKVAASPPPVLWRYPCRSRADALTRPGIALHPHGGAHEGLRPASSARAAFAGRGSGDQRRCRRDQQHAPAMIASHNSNPRPKKMPKSPMLERRLGSIVRLPAEPRQCKDGRHQNDEYSGSQHEPIGEQTTHRRLPLKRNHRAIVNPAVRSASAWYSRSLVPRDRNMARRSYSVRNGISTSAH